MNAPTKDCDHRRIDDFLDSNRVGLEDEQLLEHLNTCTACREYMETQAADSESWTSAGRLLQPGEFDHASSDEYSLATRGSGPVDPPAAIQSVLDYLSPTEEPSRLGRLGTYEVSGVVGAGGMGVVLKAVDPALDRVVAIKVMAPHLANNGTARRRFSREAKAAAAVLHPNVIPIHSVSSDEKIPYLVMAYIRGGSLQKRLDLEGPLSTVEILRIGSQVAAGLAAAHEQGLVHRDVKPENILLEEGVERITLTDFGLARAVDDASVTQQGTIAGTPQYMSPEQTRGEPIDQQSDLFSLGCVLYALCTGRPPFRADSSYAVMRKISDESPMPIRELNPEIPEWLCAIISKLMAKNKADRFESAHEVHKLLEACINHVQQPTHNELPVSLRKVLVTTQPQRGLKSLLTSIVGVFTVLGLLFTAIVAFMVQSIDDTDKSTTGQEASRQRQVIEIEEELLGDLALLQGSWITESVTESGKKMSATDKEADLVGVHLEGDEKGLPQYVDQRLPTIQVVGSTFYKIDPDDGDWHSFRIEIDSSKNPKTIDLISLRHPDERVVGIYELKDGAFKICLDDLEGVDASGWGQPNPKRKPSKRPTTFDAPAGSKHVLFECWPFGEPMYKMLHDEGKGLLGKDQQDLLVKLILERQADRKLPWSTKMGDLLEKLWIAGKLDRKLWEQYTAQFVVGIYEIKVRPRIVIGTPGGVNLQLEIQDVRCGSGKHITFEVQETNRVTKIGSTIIGGNNIPGTFPLRHQGGGRTMGNSNDFGKQTWESIRPGKQKITFEAQLAIVESSASDKDEQQDVFASRKVVIETETTFLPRGQTTVNISTDPAMKAEVDRSITIKRIETGPAVNPTTENKYYANVILDIKSRPIDTAFNIILKDGDNEYKAGSIAAAAEKKNGLNCMAFIPADLSGKRIDVILRPAPDKAELTVDLFEIWGEEIVFKDVLVTGESVADKGAEDAKEPLTWKSLLGEEPPVGYPTEPLSLIEALNNSRGVWVFAGNIKQGDAESEFEASMKIQGGFKKMIRQDSFPQWQVNIAWPLKEPSDRLGMNIMALPEPTGIKWMLTPQYFAKNGTPIRGNYPMYEGAWNSETATIVWTSKRVHAPLNKDLPAQKADESARLPSIFQMVIKTNGEMGISGYQHNDELSFSGQSAARVGEPYVESGPAIPRLPGGYGIFFASRLEVYLEAPGRFEGAGPRVEKIGCEGTYIFGLVAPHRKMNPNETPGYFWLDSETGEIVKGMEVAAWREALKSKGVSEPRLFGPEEVGQ